MVFRSTSHASETLSLDMGAATPVGGAFQEGCLPRCTSMFTLTSGEWTAVVYRITGTDGYTEPKAAVLLTNGGEQYLRVLIDRKIVKANCYQSMMGC
jgi:hypothetical protein